MTIEIEALPEFEGISIVAYQCDGHVDKGEFLTALLDEHDGEQHVAEVTVDDIQHKYVRFVPAMSGREYTGQGWITDVNGPARGAKAVTQVDISQMVVDRALSKSR